MSTYESGYDPKYGYNRNAFAHKTPGTAIMGQVVKLIATPIGLVSEAIHDRSDKKKRSKSDPNAPSPTTSEKNPASPVDRTRNDPNAERNESIYVEVPADAADELIASNQAVPADGEVPTHELVQEHEERNDGIERDEADWALDEAVANTQDDEQDVPPPSYVAATTSSKKTPSQKLVHPVILPQRRPGTKSRGFVRAYAPALQDSGIEEKQFLGFLKDFHKAAQASPVFDVIIVATAIAGFYPDIMVGLAIQAVQVVAAVGQEVQERYRTNKFLDQANKDIFMPKGLYALIVTYKGGNSEQPDIATQTVDLGATAMAKYGENLTADVDFEGAFEQTGQANADGLKMKMQNLRIASGATRESEIPVTCAPLVFPALDALASAAGSSNRRGGDDTGIATAIKGKTKDAQKFVNTYFDKRAQAKYAIENPNSTLTTQVAPVAPTFKSRFADPNNQTNKHFFTLITGGHYKAEPLGAKRRWEKAQRQAEQRRLQGRKDKSSKRMLQEGVLYLMIVNMPTEAEIKQAKEKLQAEKEKRE